MENGTILQYTITRQSVSVSMPQTAQSTALLIYSQLASVSLKIALWHILMFHSHHCSRNNGETNIHLDWWQLNNFWIVLCNQESIDSHVARLGLHKSSHLHLSVSENQMPGIAILYWYLHPLILLLHQPHHRYYCNTYTNCHLNPTLLCTCIHHPSPQPPY